jgi:hypothetical protein
MGKALKFGFGSDLPGKKPGFIAFHTFLFARKTGHLFIFD